MDEAFDLPVNYKGEGLLFTARLVQIGYNHRFLVDIYGQEVAFEPDEERNYRAIVDSSLIDQSKKINIEMLEAVANAIETVIR